MRPLINMEKPISGKPYLTLEYYSFAATFREGRVCLSDNNIRHLHGVLHIWQPV